jgi:DNA-binding CsgD family transcriptional regulator
MEPHGTPPLTPRERDVMKEAAAGYTSAEIGHHLGISEGTVRKHMEHVYAKLEVRNRAAAIAVLTAAAVDLFGSFSPGS